MKWYNSNSYFTKICSHESNWQKGYIDSGNGSAPNREEAITWSNDDPVDWGIYTALGGDELTHYMIIHLEKGTEW